MKDIQQLFLYNTRVEMALDNLHHPCCYEIVTKVPADHISPECDEIICRLPDGVDETKERRAQIIAAIPEMLDRIGDHCEWCADRLADVGRNASAFRGGPEESER